MKDMAMSLGVWRSGLVALVTCSASMPIIRALTDRWRLYDAIGPLDIHTRRIARLGGVGIVLGLGAALCIAGIGSSPEAFPLTLSVLLIWATGLLDDLWRLSPHVRLAAQTMAALLLWQAGWRLPLPLNNTANMFVGCLFILLFVNAFNLLDGSDGLAAGVAGTIALGYIVILPPAASLGSAIAWSLLGSCVAFLFFNFPPAKMFMGDSGSTVLGLIVALLGLDFYRVDKWTQSHWLFPLLIAALPLLDLAFAVLRRVRNGYPRCTEIVGISTICCCSVAGRQGEWLFSPML